MDSTTSSSSSIPNKMPIHAKTVRWQEESIIRTFKKRKTTQKLWYTPEEYNQFQEDREYVANLVKEHGVKHVECTEETTCRGLEFMFIPSRKLTSRRRSALQAVFNEQEHQKRCQVRSPEAIAQGYFLACEQSSIEARRLALLYHRESLHAEKILEAMKEKMPIQGTSSDSSSTPKSGAMRKFLLPFRAMASMGSGAKVKPGNQ
eukprot:CAMPEP_0117010912 /NCGR_PEP_ID=MMETSP0472-20121206/9497_1 /TAXON_ID=693140 ORGANISM="Tiarina fusus, Strain LIS" /NCGR_SAMPLE_ID=MMETSP0472 /ASSEMBLY_ACC=CAM_ASM_000603 /LENGTH=203 /DNA_ID=CAMNT_0004713565 /DNA_START=47 /DNA_END=658 /DNA_ORIENTATION=+